MPTDDYADFDLEITRPVRGKYQARVIESPAGQAVSEFKRPFSDLELENFIREVGRPRTGGRAVGSPEVEEDDAALTIQAYGTKLFDTVFAGTVRECLTSCLHQIDLGLITGLRIRLRLVEVPELADLPWEFLYHTTLRRFITLSNQTPMIRYTDLPRPVPPLTVSPPLKLLGMVAGPSDYPTLDANQEKSKIETALRKLQKRKLIEIEWLKKPTLASLQKHLRRGTFHLFHFIGHGGWDPEAQEGVLILEDKEGLGHPVKAEHLATILCDHKPLRMVVLNSCEGGRSSRKDPFAGVAATLVQQGIPAVLAMQFEITDSAAIKLAKVFYESLADGSYVEAAVAEARKAIFASGNEVEWGTPVLYLRAQKGRIFKVLKSSKKKKKLKVAKA